MDIPEERQPESPPAPAPFSERLKVAKVLVLQLAAHLQHLLVIKVDQATLGFRKAILAVAMLAGIGLIGLAGIVYATTLFLAGAAGGVAILVGNRPWLGQLIVGGVAIGLFLLFVYLAVQITIKQFRVALHKKYDTLTLHRKAAVEAAGLGSVGGHAYVRPPPAPSARDAAAAPAP